MLKSMKRKRTDDKQYIVFGNVSYDMQMKLETFDQLDKAIEYINENYNDNYYSYIIHEYDDRDNKINSYTYGGVQKHTTSIQKMNF